MVKKYFLFLILLSVQFSGVAQVTNIGGDENAIDFSNPKEYEIGGITVSGIKYLDHQALITLSGLTKGDKVKIPGDKITKAIENLWKQGILTDIKIVATRIEGNVIFLDLQLQEKPRLSRFSFNGVRKGEADKLREKIQIASGKVLTENLIISTTNIIKQYFIDKGYWNVEVNLKADKDTLEINTEKLLIDIKKGNRIRIKHINVEGNTALSSAKVKRAMKDTKEKIWWKIFTSSKFIDENLEQDKQRIIDKYTEKGYRDARVLKDSVYQINKKFVNVDVKIEEGHQYFFRTISWLGNTKYRSGQLDTVLNIKRGDVYNSARLDEGLMMSQSGRDVTSLYMDDGYLFFSVDPVETQVAGDSIDIEMRIREGKQARVNKVTVTGNTKTNDHVIMREIRTQPGQLFSRSDIIRTQRELAQLGYFNPEKLGVNPKPNPVDGTVDIEYVVEEKPSDQIEVSGGYGANQLVGTLGVSFTNFSARNIFNGKAWRPLPSGDGQKLSLRAVTNGIAYQSYNISFTEPWLGGKKPNALSVSAFYSIQNLNGRSRTDPLRSGIDIIGSSVGLGKRLKWPDDFFSLYHEISYQYYQMQNASSTFLFSNGYANNLAFQEVFSRNSVDAPIYPRRGSEVSFSVQFTPPYSLFSKKDYSNATDQVKYKWIEYHKWKFSTQWYMRVVGEMVLNTRLGFGFLGYYNKDIGQSPFERFYLGGNGLSGYSLDGREIIALRGYADNTVTPRSVYGNYIGGTIYDKFTMELRYPVSLNPSATIYGLAFIEAGNTWNKFKDYDPFDVKRSAGFGVRIFLPMFGLLGLDWGYGFDEIYQSPGAGGGQLHFTIGQQF